MKRTLLVIALLAAATPLFAQRTSAANVPVIHAKISVLGEVRDTTIDGSQTPQESALSPSGKFVAFNTDKDLRLWNTTTRTSSVLLTGWSESIVWSPAGDAIAFGHDGDQGSQSIWTIRLDQTTGRIVGSPQRVSLSSATGNAPQFSPDGRLIAFGRLDAGRRTSLVVVPASGGAERAVASGYAIRRLRWSPDGTAINYLAHTDSTLRKATLYRVPLSGGAPRVVHEVDVGSGLPAFSGDARMMEVEQPTTIEGGAIAFSGLDAKPVARVVYPLDVWLGDWSGSTRRGGLRIARQRGLRAVNATDGTSRDLIDSTSEVLSAAWFADGRRVAAIALRDGAYALTTMNADGSGVRRFPLSALPQRGEDERSGALLRVSPDGHYATFLGINRSSLELMDLSNGRQRTLVRAAGVLTPFWRPDSKSIRYIRVDAFPITNDNRSAREVTVGGEDKLVRVLPASQYPNVVWGIDENTITAFGAGTHTLISLDGKADQVTSRVPAQGAGALSPDRKTMALRLGATRAPKAAGKITLVSLADMSRRDIELPFADIGVMYFAPDGRSIFIRGREGTDPRDTLYSVPHDGTAPRAIAKVESREQIGQFVMSPEGRSFLHSVSGVRGASFVAADFSELNTHVTQAGKAP